MAEQTTKSAVDDFYRKALLPPPPVNWGAIAARQEAAQKRLAEKQDRISGSL